MAEPYEEDIVALATAHTDFRRQVVTGAHARAALMTVPPGG